MGTPGDDDDDASVAYRKPAPSSDPVDAPTSWRRPSSKVLGALARLTRARGADEASDDLDARSARATVPSQRPVPVAAEVQRALARCTDGNDLFAKGEHDAARQRYERWLTRSQHRPHSTRDRVEVLVMLAVLRRWDRERIAAESALREAITLPDLHLREDAPLEGALALAGALRDLERSSDLLATRQPTSAIDEALLLRARADDALAHGETDLAFARATEALSRWNRLVEADHREHIATRLTIARVHLRAKQWATASRQLALILETDDRQVDRGLAARAWSAAAEAHYQREEYAKARSALSLALLNTNHWLPGPFATNAPVFRTCARLFDRLGDRQTAAEADEALRELADTHRACLSQELR